jgi:hypothetical protein
MNIFVDVDDTIVRSFGTKRIPIPQVIEAIRQLHAKGETLYCWSRGGAEYAQASAIEFGIERRSMTKHLPIGTICGKCIHHQSSIF